MHPHPQLGAGHKTKPLKECPSECHDRTNMHTDSADGSGLLLLENSGFKESLSHCLGRYLWEVWR